MKRIALYILSTLSLLMVTNGCTNLEEQVLDETFSATISETEAARGLIAPCYSPLPNIYLHTNYFALQEITTDEAILPYRGGTDWGDNGIYIDLNRHTYNSNTANVRNTWNVLVQGISRCVTAIAELPRLKDPNANTFLAEAIGMKAFYNILVFDLYGIAFKKEDPGQTSEILRGEVALNYIIAELERAEPNLPTKSGAGTGRLTKAGAWGLLARLHLNAAVYRDRYAANFDFKAADMDKVIAYCDRIINSGDYRLSADYFAIFNDENNTNPELVFAVDQRPDLNGHNRLAYFSLSGDQFPLPQFPGANGTDGPAITSDFYRTWVNAYGGEENLHLDPRFSQRNMKRDADGTPSSCVAASEFKYDRGILRGQQYGLIRINGVFQRCEGDKYQVGPLTNLTRNRPDRKVLFTEKVDFTPEGSDYPTGYRVLKFEFSKQSNTGRNRGNVDIPIVRLADVYMMRAEAQLRKNNAAAALTDVNAVRAARTATTPAPALATITLDLLYRERGFEFYWELQRRTDMVRFGKYEGTWTEKNSTDRFKRIFPIPQTAIDGASNLVGYLSQNPGY